RRLGDVPGTGPDGLVLRLVAAVAEAVLEVQAQILDRLSGELLLDLLGDVRDLGRVLDQPVQPDELGAPADLRHGRQRRRPPLARGRGTVPVAGQVDRVDRLAGAVVAGIGPRSGGVHGREEGLDLLEDRRHPAHSWPAPSGSAPVSGSASPLATRSARTTSTTAAATAFDTAASKTEGTM